MALVFSIIQQVIYMKVIGNLVKKMDVVFFHFQITLPIMENGLIIKQMVKVLLYIQIMINIKVILRII